MQANASLDAVPLPPGLKSSHFLCHKDHYYHSATRPACFTVVVFLWQICITNCCATITNHPSPELFHHPSWSSLPIKLLASYSQVPDSDHSINLFYPPHRSWIIQYMHFSDGRIPFSIKIYSCCNVSQFHILSCMKTAFYLPIQASPDTCCYLFLL